MLTLFSDIPTTASTEIFYGKVYCSHCVASTNHDSIVSYGYNQDIDNITIGYKYSIIKCLGCNSISFAEEILNHEDVYQIGYDYNDEPIYEENKTYNFYPQREEGLQGAINFEKVIPEHIFDIYNEVRAAITSKLNITATFGLRLLLELIGSEILKNDLKTDDLVKILEALHNKGYISQLQKELLDTIRTIGNDAAHRAKGLKIEELKINLSIIQNIMSMFFFYYKNNKQVPEKVVSPASLSASPSHPIPNIPNTISKPILKKKL